jgi:hypothetical protein
VGRYGDRPEWESVLWVANVEDVGIVLPRGAMSMGAGVVSAGAAIAGACGHKGKRRRGMGWDRSMDTGQVRSHWQHHVPAGWSHLRPRVIIITLIDH